MGINTRACAGRMVAARERRRERPSKPRISCLGAAPSDYSLTFWFDKSDLISRIDEIYSFIVTGEPPDHIPAHVRTSINRVLANQKPMVPACVDENSAPSLSLRGSFRSTAQPSSRSAYGFATRAAGTGHFYPRPTATVVPVSQQPLQNDPDHPGRGKLVDDRKIRHRSSNLSPEVEQRHDPRIAGVPP